MKFTYLVCTSLLCISACASTQPAVPQGMVQVEKENIGWTDGKCLVIKNAVIQTGQKIELVEFGRRSAQRNVAVLKLTSDPAVCPALLPDRASVNQDAGYFFYELAGADDLGMGIAFLTYGERNKYEVGSCVSSEGIVFSAKPKGENEKGDWNGYYYLGYDTESTCPE